ncbi:hypothetical protein [Aliihoeflea sp. PC F10.4]
MPIFLTALSKRVGEWVKSVSPTFEVAHSPFPGRLAGERLAQAGARRLGVVELDRMPGGLVEEILSVAKVELSDATGFFDRIRSDVDEAELHLVRYTDEIARAAFAVGDAQVDFVGDFTGPVERAVRLAGAEECYVAVAPDLSKDRRFIRAGKMRLGRSFAVRLSVAYNGVWVRRIQSFSSDADLTARFARTYSQLDAEWPALHADALDVSAVLPPNSHLLDWHLEAPMGTRPLTVVASEETPLRGPVAYGILTAAFHVDGETVVAARPIGLGTVPEHKGEAA